MKYLLYAIIGLVAFALFYLGIVNREQPKSTSNQLAKQSANTAHSNWQTQTNDQPPVTVRVTPVELGKDTKTWKFQVVFDTHSGNLDDDLLTVVDLIDDKSNTYRPLAWEGQETGSHHREGVSGKS